MTVIRSFEDLKKGFGDYLEQLAKNENKDYSYTGSEVSIFMYADEFNDYMNENRTAIEDFIKNNSENGKNINLGSMNINEILDLTCKNGKVLTGDQFDSEGLSDDTGIVAGVLYDLLQDENFKGAIDANNDGDLSEEEFADFLNAIEDGNNGEITLDGIMQAVKGINSAVEDEDTDIDETEEANSSPSSSGTSGTSGPSGTSGGYSSGSPSSSGSYDLTENPDEMTAEEIKVELDAAEGELDAKKSELDDAKSDTTPDEKFKEYMDEMKNVDKDKAEDIENYRNEIETIKEIDQSIEEQTSIKENAEDKISNAESQLSTIDSSIEQLENEISSADEDTDTDLLQSQITELEEQKSEIEAEKAAAEQEKTNAENKITELENQKNEHPSIEELEGKITEIEDTLLENNEELQAKKDAYDEATEAKDKKIETLNGEISQLESKVEELRAKYTEAKNAENEEATAKTITKATMQYDEEAGQKLLDAAFNNILGTSGWCLKGVNTILNAVYGEQISTGGSAYQAADSLATGNGVGAHFAEVDVPPEELTSLPAGAIIVWDRGGNASSAGQTHGHISIATGDGREISDHIQSQTTYESRQVSYRVFYPIS